MPRIILINIITNKFIFLVIIVEEIKKINEIKIYTISLKKNYNTILKKILKSTNTDHLQYRRCHGLRRRRCLRL